MADFNSIVVDRSISVLSGMKMEIIKLQSSGNFNPDSSNTVSTLLGSVFGGLAWVGNGAGLASCVLTSYSAATKTATLEGTVDLASASTNGLVILFGL